MTQLACMRLRSLGLRRRKVVIRCVVVALLLVALSLLHRNRITNEAAQLIEWSSQRAAEWTRGAGGTGGTADRAKPQPTKAAPSSLQDAKEGAKPTGDKGDKSKAVLSSLADTVMHLLETFVPSGIDPPWPTDRFSSKPWHWGGVPEPAPSSITAGLQLDEFELNKMKRAHQGFLGAVDSRLPHYIPHRYYSISEESSSSSTTTPPSQGIVTVGGGKYFVVLVVSLRFLRRAGTTLPVEVFVPEDEYERKVCENVLPKLNAVCRVFPQLRVQSSRDGSGWNRVAIQGFQLKAFALLFASFDEVLFLDADNTAMHDVGPLFASAPFRQTGLVTWPDIWPTTVAPLYYDIATPATVRSPADQPSTETGQLLIDKRRHWKTLLLAVCYNYHGPRFYYRLLNQGGPGMGDKETFLPAAAVVGLPAYQVHHPVDRVGHRFEDNSTSSRVLVQHDAAEDWAVTEAIAAQATADAPQTEAEWNARYQGHVRPLFLHLSWPKWDPANLLQHMSKWSDMTKGVNGKPEPAFHYPPELAAPLRGTERMLWEEARWVACHHRSVFRHWHNNHQAKLACNRLDIHFKRVLDTDVGRDMGLGPEDVLYPALPDSVTT